MLPLTIAVTMALLLAVPATSTPDHCLSNPCSGGSTCQNALICPPLHANQTQLVTAPSLHTYNSAVSNQQGATTCINRDSTRAAVFAPSDGVYLSNSGAIFIYDVSIPSSPTLLASIPMSTGTYYGAQPLKCVWTDDGTTLAYGMWALYMGSGLPDMPGGVVLVATSNSWTSYTRQALVCSQSSSADVNSLVSIDVNGNGQYIVVGVAVHNNQDGLICLWNKTTPAPTASWTEVNITGPSPLDIVGGGGLGTQFGNAVKISRFGAKMLIAATYSWSGGCVYEFEYVLSSGWVGTGTCLQPSAMPTMQAGFGISLDANDDLSAFIASYGGWRDSHRHRQQGGAGVQTKINGTWVDLYGLLLPPTETGALNYTSSGDPVFYDNGGLQMDGTGTVYCQSDAYNVGPAKMYSGSVWCRQLLATNWVSVGGIITDGTVPSGGVANTQFGMSLALPKAYTTLTNPTMVIGSSYNSNNVVPFPVGGAWFFGNHDLGYCSSPRLPGFQCVCASGL